MFRQQRAGWRQFVVVGISAPAEMPAGLVAVTVNNSTEAPTGPIFARLNEGVSQEQFMEALMADESGMAAISLVTLLGGAQAGAGESVRTVFDLKPGNHIALGFGEGPPQLANFTVAAGSGAAPAAPAAAVNAELLDFQFALPDQIKAGVQTWQIENKGGQWHEMVVVKLNEGVTADDLMAMMMSGEEPDGPPPFEQVAFWAPGAHERGRAGLDGRRPAGRRVHRALLPARLRLDAAQIAPGARHGADVDGDGVIHPCGVSTPTCGPWTDGPHLGVLTPRHHTKPHLRVLTPRHHTKL